MNELKETIDNICDDFAAILAARSRELDRREAFDQEISEQIQNLLKEKK